MQLFGTFLLGSRLGCDLGTLLRRGARGRASLGRRPGSSLFGRPPLCRQTFGCPFARCGFGRRLLRRELLCVLGGEPLHQPVQNIGICLQVGNFGLIGGYAPHQLFFQCGVLIALDLQRRLLVLRLRCQLREVRLLYLLLILRLDDLFARSLGLGDQFQARLGQGLVVDAETPDFGWLFRLQPDRKWGFPTQHVGGA
ncbi:hypothetical protein [Acidithiobacillus sp. AMEEHan]|uniref:hypothetical protein n=1 Tax=Acidithiobacillus sp. AMEEHan TaxID=2994951 RepID=UPI0027E5AFAF|nr:hypothetical protein [Acidithiobacillus sp. AMEEHan]